VTIAYRACVFISLTLVSSPALGQQSRGAGISGGAGPGVSIDYVREHWGPPDSVRLVAAVIWHGRSIWNFFPTGSPEGIAARTLQDSMSRVSRERHRLGAGAMSPRANAWVEYDEAKRTVYVLDQAYAVSAGDSTVVLLVESVDGSNGPPLVTRVMMAHPAYGPQADSTASGYDSRDIGALHRRWGELLQENSEVRIFLEHAARTKLPNER
jgi:hypothetical protein